MTRAEGNPRNTQDPQTDTPRTVPEAESHIKAFEIYGEFMEDMGEIPISFVGSAYLDVSTDRFFGKLSDYYGESDIVGQIDGQEMEFRKLYKDPKEHGGASDPIKYSLRKKNGKWIGTYAFGPTFRFTREASLKRFSEVNHRGKQLPDFEGSYSQIAQTIQNRQAEAEARIQENLRTRELGDNYIKNHPTEERPRFSLSLMTFAFVLARAMEFRADEATLNTVFAEFKQELEEKDPDALDLMTFDTTGEHPYSAQLQACINDLVRLQILIPSPDMKRFQIKQSTKDSFVESDSKRVAELGQWGASTAFTADVKLLASKLDEKLGLTPVTQ